MRLAPNTDTVPVSVNIYLMPYERQVITAHLHPAIVAIPVGAAVAGLIAAIVSSTSAFSFDALLIIWLAWGLLFLYTIGKMFGWLENYFIVTSQRVILIEGILTRDVTSVPHAQVASVRFRRSAMGRLLGYGQFIIECGRSQPKWTVNFIPYPEQLYLETTGLIFRDRDPDDGPAPGWQPGQPEPRGSRRTEQPGDEVYPEHDRRGEDKERGP